MATSPAQKTDASHIVELTNEAFTATQAAAALAAEGVAAPSDASLQRMREYERQLDSLDRDIDDLVTTSVCGCDEKQARELLACMKFAISLERIGDLLLSFSNRADQLNTRLDDDDVRELSVMAKRLSQMVTAATEAFQQRNLDRAVSVLRDDSEMDRLCNLVMFRHLEPHDGERQGDSFHVLFMAQELERAGDHAKNIAEEVCHLISGRTVRHILRSYDRPVEQLFIEHMRRQGE